MEESPIGAQCNIFSLLVRDAAAASLNKLSSGSLEWRSEREVTRLSENGQDLSIVPSATWADSVNAFTKLFAPANCMSLGPRDVNNLKPAPGQSAADFALEVLKAFNRLLPETTHSAPPSMTPKDYAWSLCMIAAFERGLLPAHEGRND